VRRDSLIKSLIIRGSWLYRSLKMFLSWELDTPPCLYCGKEKSAMNSSLRRSSCVSVLLPLLALLLPCEEDEGSDLIATPILLVADVDMPIARRFTAGGAPVNDDDDDGRFGGMVGLFTVLCFN